MFGRAPPAGTSIERLEPVLRDLGEAPSSEQDIVSPDAAELAAMEFGKVALVARDGASLDADAVPRPGEAGWLAGWLAG